MEHLRTQDTQQLLACLRELVVLDDLESFPTRAMAALRTVVPALHSGYNELNPRKRRLVYLFDTAGIDFPGSAQLFLAYLHEHPVDRG